MYLMIIIAALEIISISEFIVATWFCVKVMRGIVVVNVFGKGKKAMKQIFVVANTL